MRVKLLVIALNAVLFSGASLGDQVRQTPLNIVEKRGEEARISCSHSIQNYNVILWYKRLVDKQLQLLGYRFLGESFLEPGVAVKMEGSADRDQTCTLMIKELNESSSGVYFCAARQGGNYGDPAYFGKGTKLTVLEKDINVTPPTVKILEPSNKECKDKKGKKKKTLVCVASGFYPDHVRVFWTRDGVNVIDGVSTDAAAKRDGKYYKITSRLIVPIMDWIKPKIEFKCIVSFFNGTSNIESSDTFTTTGTDNPGMTRENYIKISQNAKLSYSVLIVKSCLYAALVCFLVWKLQGKLGKQTK